MMVRVPDKCSFNCPALVELPHHCCRNLRHTKCKNTIEQGRQRSAWVSPAQLQDQEVALAQAIASACMIDVIKQMREL